jgi:hypothetical protein
MNVVNFKENTYAKGQKVNNEMHSADIYFHKIIVTSASPLLPLQSDTGVYSALDSLRASSVVSVSFTSGLAGRLFIRMYSAVARSAC